MNFIFSLLLCMLSFAQPRPTPSFKDYQNLPEEVHNLFEDFSGNKGAAAAKTGIQKGSAEQGVKVNRLLVRIEFYLFFHSLVMMLSLRRKNIACSKMTSFITPCIISILPIMRRSHKGLSLTMSIIIIQTMSSLNPTLLRLRQMSRTWRFLFQTHKLI
jgi:hypothetical protein